MTNQIFIVGKQFKLSERLKKYIFNSIVDLELNFEPQVCYCHVNLRKEETFCNADIIVHCHGRVLKVEHNAEVFYGAVDGAIKKMAQLLDETSKTEKPVESHAIDVFELAPR